MTLIDQWEPPDPRAEQKRIAVAPGGRQVWVTITGDDRLRLIKALPGRWPDVLMARERGETIEQIHRWAHVPLIPEWECFGNCDPPCLRDLIATCYLWLETELNEIARRRAALL